MSMRNHPMTGYLVPASKFKDFIPEKSREQYEAAVSACDREEVADILRSHIPSDFPAFSGVWCPAEEDNVDDPEAVQTGEVYVIFDESDLFVKQYSNQHIAMKREGIVPEFHSWSIWA